MVTEVELIRSAETPSIMRGHYTLLIAMASVGNRREWKGQPDRKRGGLSRVTQFSNLKVLMTLSILKHERLLGHSL